MGNLPYPVAVIGSRGIVVVGIVAKLLGDRLIARIAEPKERYRRGKFLNTAIVIVVTCVLVEL